MKRELLPTLISYKRRSVKVQDKWIPVASTFDLNTIRLNEIAEFDLAQTLDGEYYIVSKGGLDANEVNS